MNHPSYGLGNAGPEFPSREGGLMAAREKERVEEAQKIAAFLVQAFAEHAELKKHPATKELLCDYHVRGEIQKIDPNFTFPEVN